MLDRHADAFASRTIGKQVRLDSMLPVVPLIPQMDYDWSFWAIAQVALFVHRQ